MIAEKCYKSNIFQFLQVLLRNFRSYLKLGRRQIYSVILRILKPFSAITNSATTYHLAQVEPKAEKRVHEFCHLIWTEKKIQKVWIKVLLKTRTKRKEMIIKLELCLTSLRSSPYEKVDWLGLRLPKTKTCMKLQCEAFIQKRKFCLPQHLDRYLG